MSLKANSSATPSMGWLAIFVLHGRAKILLLLGMRSSAAQVFQQVLQRQPQDLLALNSLGFNAMHEGNSMLALSYFEQVVKITPASSNAHFNQAFVCEALGHLEAAEGSFRAAIAIETTMDRAWYGLGLVLIRQRRHEEALVALKRNTQLQPMSPFGWYQLARVHVDLGQTDEARFVIQNLRGFEPKVAAQLKRETGINI